MSVIDLTIVDVGPVDGLQGLSAFMPTISKLHWIRQAAAAGVRSVEVTSFVPPKLLPQFADAETVLASALLIPDLSARVLVPNLKGVQRAVSNGARSLSYAFSASEAHSLSNLRKSREAQFADFLSIIEFLETVPKDSRPAFSVGISTCFGCSIQGDVSERDVLEYATRLVGSGADSIVLADTVGYAGPRHVSRLVRAVRGEVGERLAGIHLHDTRGLGLANAAAAIDEGIIEIDASLGGLGGCPFAPGATGNIALEDLVFMAESMGLRTGIDIGALLDLRKDLVGLLPSGDFHGALAKAGLPKTFKFAS